MLFLAFEINDSKMKWLLPKAKVFVATTFTSKPAHTSAAKFAEPNQPKPNQKHKLYY